VANSRALAEDATEIISVQYEELEAVTDMRTALDRETPVIHPQLGDNLAFERILDAGHVDEAFSGSDEGVEADFIFGRHTGVTLEPRAVVADWNPAEERLTIYQGTQAPHMVQNIAALHLGLSESQVRVVCKDVGGSFGIKVHIYADEMATYACRNCCGRPIKFVADRVESFNTDIHARDHRCRDESVSSATAPSRYSKSMTSPDRSLFNVPTHQRDRGQPGRQSRRWALSREELPCPRSGRVPKQECNVPVPAPSGIRSPAR